MAQITLTHYETRAEAEEAERLAIAVEKPLWNVMHNRAVVEMRRARVPTQHDPVDERDGSAGWPRPGEVATMFGVSRQTIHRWMESGRVRYRRLPTGYRVLNPEDVRKLLDEYRQEHGGTVG